MTYGPFPPWSPYGAPVPPPMFYPPPIQPQQKGRSTLKALLKDWEAWEEFQKKHRKDEKRQERKSWLHISDWFMLLCVINSFTIPLYIILWVKYLR
jgi:hypothetical protein